MKVKETRGKKGADCQQAIQVAKKHNNLFLPMFGRDKMPKTAIQGYHYLQQHLQLI